MGGTPQLPRNMADGSGFINWMKWVESKISFILEKLNNPFANTGLSVPVAGTTQVDGFFHVVGTMRVEQSTAFASGLSADSLQVISGITFLPNQSILNNWLANPLQQTLVSPSATNFALTASMVQLASQTFAIPAGFTAVKVDVTATVGAVNSTGATNYLNAQPKIVRVSDSAAWSPTVTGTPVPAGLEGTSTARWVADVPLAPGDSVQIVVQGSGGGGWAANASNYADVVGTLTWYRT